MHELKQTLFITKNFHALQGLRIVPLGLLLVAQSAGWLGPQGNCTWSLLALVAAIALFWLIGKYYDRAFGRVVRTREERRREWIIALVVLAAIYGFAVLDSALSWPVSVAGLMLAAGFLTMYVFSARHWGSGFRVHYVILAALMAGVSVLPALRLAPRYQLFGPSSAPLLIVLGLIIIVGGLLDHVLLSQLLKPLPEKNHG
jgi:hypothetical protein